MRRPRPSSPPSASRRRASWGGAWKRSWRPLRWRRRAAEAVGRRLKKLGEGSQVLCVTHLAQIAGFGDHHYFVEKQTAKGRTLASVTELAPEERTREIGRMLSGERITPEALRHAEQL